MNGHEAIIPPDIEFEMPPWYKRKRKHDVLTTFGARDVLGWHFGDTGVTSMALREHGIHLHGTSGTTV